MKLKTQQKLIAEYNKLTHPKETTAIKYYFQYHGVNINIYFDAYDENNLSMNLVLKLEKHYYYTSLNIKNTNINKEYLDEIPSEILNAILDDNNTLDGFYQHIEEYIENNDSRFINYNNETLFTNTLKFNKNEEDLPFIRGIRKVPMTDKTFNKLNETMGIDKDILNKIRNNNMTLVRTASPEKRKNITIILGEKNINL